MQAKLNLLLQAIAKNGHHIAAVQEALTSYFYSSNHSPIDELSRASIQRIEIMSSYFKADNLVGFGQWSLSIPFEARAQFTLTGLMTNSDFGAYVGRIERVLDASEDEKEVTIDVVKSIFGTMSLRAEVCLSEQEHIDLNHFFEGATIAVSSVEQ